MNKDKWLKIFSVTLVILVFLFLSLSLAKQIVKPKATRIAEEQKNTLAIAEDDADQDGLPDWEEKLWGTDVNSSDTDGDGTSDGEEVKLGQNPNGRENAINFEKIREVNQDFKKFVEQIDSGVRVLPTLTSNKLTATTTSPLENPIRAYGNILGKIISENAPKTTTESAVFNSVIKTGAPASFDQLALIGRNYENLVLAIRKTTPPDSLATNSSNLALNYSLQSESIKNIASFKNQGKAPVEVYQAHNKNVLATGENLMDLILFFKNHGIIFSQNEPGQIFNLPF